MLLFRSEEHLERWLETRPEPPGATLTVDELWQLSAAWWSDRLAPDWRPRTLDESQAILDGLGLTAPFWRLA